jgi:8-oxo-dGTP pyrophosphatase MutT (NUDIX family)
MNKSAGIIIILNKSKVLLCRSSNSILSSTYSFPKGGIEKGEKKIDAAIREVFEETSVVVSKKQIINKRAYCHKLYKKKDLITREFIYIRFI